MGFVTCDNPDLEVNHMGTTFVSLQHESSEDEIGFWMRDGILELWLRLLALHLPESPENHSMGYEIRRNWLLASGVHFGGCVPHELHLATATEEGRKLVRMAIVSLMQRLAKAPATLNGPTLDLLGMEGTFANEFETWRLIEVGDAFLNLLDGKLECTVKSTAFMPGSK